MKKFLAFLLALTMLLGVGALAEENAPLFQQDVMILFTSDVHCGIESNFGYAGLAMVRDAYKNAGYHVLLVDNGDLIKDSMIADIAKFAESFKAKTGFGLDIDDGAKRELISLAVDKDKSVAAVCEEVFRDFKHGLAIVARNTGGTSFAITADCIKSPDKYLSDMVVRSFGNREK